MSVICDRAGSYAACEGCEHRLAHDPVAQIDTMTAGRKRTCRSWGSCVLEAFTGRRLDREHVTKVRCRRVL